MYRQVAIDRAEAMEEQLARAVAAHQTQSDLAASRLTDLEAHQQHAEELSSDNSAAIASLESQLVQCKRTAADEAVARAAEFEIERVALIEAEQRVVELEAEVRVA